jgi:hypothetical protein
VFYRRFKNRNRSLNQSDRRERGFNRSRFLNYKTRVVFKIFSNTNILSEILINSEIIRGASQYTKCGGCREYYGNNINKFGKKTIFIVEMCQNVPEEIRNKGQLVTNEVPSGYEKVYVSFQGWKHHGGNGRCHFGFFLIWGKCLELH